jgi:hypothetical protein
MPLKVTSTPYFLIPYLQAFQNGGRLNFWGGCKTCTSQRGTIKCCVLIDFQGWTSFNETIFVKNKKYEHGGRFNVKIHSLFCGDNSWTVALRQMNFGIIRDHGHTYKLYLNHFFYAVFKYGDGAKFWGYIVINSEQLCVEFCNFVQCHILVKYLTFTIYEWNIKI